MDDHGPIRSRLRGDRMTVALGYNPAPLPRDGEPSHYIESRWTTPCRGEVGPVSPLGDALSRGLGCPVKVNYQPNTREVVAVAYPDSGPEIRVTLPAPIALQLINNAFPALKNDLLKELRRQMG